VSTEPGRERSGRERSADITADQLPNLESLRKFVVVAEELSFTRASRRLHVVQSGVSSAVAALERELGAVLFDRDRHTVALTDAGRALLPEARATLAAARSAAEAVAEATTGLRGTLSVGMMISTGSVDVPAALGRFHETYPGVLVRLRVLPGGSADLARAVAGEAFAAAGIDGAPRGRQAHPGLNAEAPGRAGLRRAPRWISGGP
jgi:DNA-binding transcriptional LysR family regulator